jgi:hypothetical protein
MVVISVWSGEAASLYHTRRQDSRLSRKRRSAGYDIRTLHF